MTKLDHGAIHATNGESLIVRRTQGAVRTIRPMKPRWLLVLAVFCSVALAGCAVTSPAPGATPTVSTSPSADAPAAAAAAASQLTITLDNIEYAHDDLKEVVQLTDAQGVLGLFEDVTGVTPEGVSLPEPSTEGNQYGTRYKWNDLYVIVFTDGGPSSITILAPAVNGVPIHTEDGISVGSPRADVIAALGENSDADSGDTIMLDSREVPGTSSLEHPGSVCIEYILLMMKDDMVAQLSIPANDFNDV